MNREAASKHWIPTALWTAGGLAFSLALAAFAYTGSFIRYLADDYCFTGAIRLWGFWRALPEFYMTTSNRYSGIFFMGLSEFLGEWTIRAWPAFIILLWVVAAWLLLRQLELVTKLCVRNAALFFAAAALIYFTVLEAPDRLQSIYWRSGSVTYAFPLALLTLGAAGGLALWRRERIPAWGIVAALLFAWVTAGLSETYAAVQTTIIVLALAGSFLWLRGDARKRALTLLLPALLGSLIALVLLAVSPGNQRRFELLPEPPDPITLVALTFRYAFDFMVDTLRTQPLPNLVSLLVAGAAGFLLGLPALRGRAAAWLLGLPLAAYILVAAATMPSVYAESAYPEPRALMVPRFVLVVFWMSTAFLAGWLARGLTERKAARFTRPLSFAVLTLLALACLYPLRTALQTWQSLPAERAWAQAWDERDADIRAQVAGGASEANVRAFDSRGRLQEFNEEPDFWVNRCGAQFYGIDNLRATP